MPSQVNSHSRAENSADLLRIRVALGLLALLASFDGAAGSAAAEPAPAPAGIAPEQSR
jgi:hypothetical protein